MLINLKCVIVLKYVKVHFKFVASYNPQMLNTKMKPKTAFTWLFNFFAWPLPARTLTHCFVHWMCCCCVCVHVSWSKNPAKCVKHQSGGSLPLTTAPQWWWWWWWIVRSVILTPQRGASSWETYNVWQLCKAQQCPLIFTEQKLWAVKKRPSGAKRKRPHCPPPHSTSPPRPHLPVVLAWQWEGDFYFGFAAGGQSSLGCGIRGDVAMFPPSLVFQPFPAVSLGQRAAAFHLLWEAAAQSCAITRRAEVRVQSHEWCMSKMLLQMISVSHSDISQCSQPHRVIFVYFSP